MNDHNNNDWSSSWNPISYNGEWKPMILFREHSLPWIRGDIGYHKLDRKCIGCGHLIMWKLVTWLKNLTWYNLQNKVLLVPLRGMRPRIPSPFHIIKWTLYGLEKCFWCYSLWYHMKLFNWHSSYKWWDPSKTSSNILFNWLDR